jgi:predicted cupin superfamily sugar epimerase
MRRKVYQTWRRVKLENRTSKYWIKKLNLLAHPEGGWFKEVYRSKETVQKNALPDRFTGNRSISTAIYYLLEKGDFSAFHRIKSDEIWHFYDGEPLEIIEINPDGNLIKHCLGLNPDNNCFPQIVIPAQSWFAARPAGTFTLVGCTVSPGFDFEDFEMGEKKKLSALFPEHKRIIEELCR